MPYTTPDIPNSVTHISTEIIVDAPIETVWNVLLDFSSYEKWNTFVRSQLITDVNFSPLNPQPMPTEGAYLVMHARIPPGGLGNSKKGLTRSEEIVTFVDVEHHRVGWKQLSYPDWLLKAHRWQYLEEIEVEGKKMVKYSTVETFSGPFAWIIRSFLTKNLQTSFNAMAQNLKEYSEQLTRED